MSKKLLTGLLIFAFVFSFNIDVNQVEAAEYTLRFGMAVGEADPMFDGAEEFAERVEERTDGAVLVDIFPDAQLGSTADMEEQARAGANVSALTDPGRMSDYVRDIGILNMGYLAEDYEEAREIVLSEWFDEVAEDLRDEGFQVLAMNWYQGTRHFYTQKEVYGPEDLEGVLTRTIGSDPWVETIRAMGAEPTSMDWGEVYTGMEHGTIDAVEAQHPAAYGASLYEVADYLVLTGHTPLITGPVVGVNWFDELPEEYQQILIEEAEKAGDYASEVTIREVENYEQLMVEEGIEVIEPDRDAFAQAVESAYEEMEFLELREEIRSMLE